MEVRCLFSHCYKDIPANQGYHKNRICHRQCNPENLYSLRKECSAHSSFTFGLWSCQLAVNHTICIQALANMSGIQMSTSPDQTNTVALAALSVDFLPHSPFCWAHRVLSSYLWLSFAAQWGVSWGTL